MPTLSLQHGCLGTSHAHLSLWGDVIPDTINSGTALVTSATRRTFPHKLREEVAFFLKTNQDQQTF